MLGVTLKWVLWLFLFGVAHASVAATDSTSFHSGLLELLPNHRSVFNDIQTAQAHTFVQSPLQKVNGQWRYSEGNPLKGRVQSTTYTFDTVDIHLLASRIQQVASQYGLIDQFSCETLACGRSYAWATEIYRNKLLHGKDTHQFYWLWQKEGRWFSVYVTERSNHRLYLHFVELTEAHSRDIAGLSHSASLWSQQGYAVIKIPRLQEDNVLNELSHWLSSKGVKTVAVVGHNHSEQLTADQKRRQSLIDAEQVVAKLPASVTGKAYGLGALVIRKELIDKGWRSWVEVVTEPL